MDYFREDNTEGFSSQELKLLNEALAEILKARPDLDPRDVGDRLNNSWVLGVTVAEIIKRTGLLIGIE